MICHPLPSPPLLSESVYAYLYHPPQLLPHPTSLSDLPTNTPQNLISNIPYPHSDSDSDSEGEDEDWNEHWEEEYLVDNDQDDASQHQPGPENPGPVNNFDRLFLALAGHRSAMERAASGVVSPPRNRAFRPAGRGAPRVIDLTASP